MNNIKQKIELLAPAGNLEKLATAFAFGADAVYLGLPDFSLRQRVNGFDLDKLQTAVQLAKKQGKRIYVTVNIFAHNKHLETLPQYLKTLAKLKVDALIISDPGILAMAKKYAPKLKLHLSTQANCTNWQAAEFWYKQGISRIVLGRETPLKDIKEIHKRCPKVELEYFVHGAMCMAYSGRCFLSQAFTGRSANLGDCAQPCRWRYKITEVVDENRQLDIEEDENGSYLFNSKDLCLIDYMKDMIKAGITSFKIEGRAKSVYYVANTVNIYARAIKDLARKKPQENWQALKEELETRLVHRGYTTGFLLDGQPEQNVANQNTLSAWEFCGQVLSSQKNSDDFMLNIKVHNTLKIGDQLEIVRPQEPNLSFTLSELYNEEKEIITEAHGGGQGETRAIIVCPVDCPTYSIVRRQLKNSHSK